jgi:hypothetical protein
MKNITVKQLFESTPEEFKEYHEILKHLIPKIPPIGKQIKSLTDLSYGKVALIRSELGVNEFETILNVFKAAFKIKRDNVLNMEIVQFYQALNWLQEELKTLSMREKKFLSAEPDPVLKEAGIDRLNVFTDLNPLINLAKQYSKSPDEVSKWNYNLVFSLLLHGKIMGEIDVEYRRIKEANQSNR